MKTLTLICALSVGVFGQQPPDSMTKMTVTIESSAPLPRTFPTVPMTVYRVGTHYCRSEEAPNTAEHAQWTSIASEPDSWAVNLLKKKAEHLVDPGPTLECHMPIFRDKQVKGDKDTNPFLDLEFGLEMQYFKGKGAEAKPGPVLREKPTTAYTGPIKDWQVTLYTTGTPERPWALSRQRGNTTETFWYEVYEQVPFNAQLIAKPDGVKIQEVR
jgi:hypothetical protein